MIRQRFDRIVQKLELNQAPIRLNRSLFVGVRTKREKRADTPLLKLNDLRNGHRKAEAAAVGVIAFTPSHERCVAICDISGRSTVAIGILDNGAEIPGWQALSPAGQPTLMRSQMGQPPGLHHRPFLPTTLRRGSRYLGLE